MENAIRKYTKLGFAIIVATAVNHVQLVQAGWSGAMNGTGFGQVTVNVTASTEKVRILNTTNMQNPSAAIKTTSGYAFGASLPTGSSAATVARVIGSSGYVWQANTVGSNGDTTDNPELENRVHIVPADCAAVVLKSESLVAPSGNSGTITVNANGTAGTAIWLRGFEYTGDQGALPEDDATTPLNEFVEYLKAHGSLKWDVLIVGPFDFSTTNCTGLTIPFTIDTDTNNLYFVTDAVAKSLPLVIVCPPDVPVNDCQQVVTYPPVQFAGCGEITLSYSRPDGVPFPVGVTPVTVTATDKDGNQTNCIFNVIVTDNSAPVLTSPLPVLNGEASVAVTPPDLSNVTDNCGGTVTVSTTNSLVYTNQGTFTVYWDFSDGHGNTNTSPQTVIVKDVTPPEPPTLAAAMGQCSVTVTPPTAMDAVAGTITGTTTNQLTYNTQGTFTVHWTFNDGNGNISTADQAVTVKDITSPVISGCPASIVLQTDPTQTTCGKVATWTLPTASDNCTLVSFTATHAPGTTLPVGITTVTYTAQDGATPPNITTGSFTVKVEDKTPPVVPSLPTLTGGCGTNLTLPVPTTTDNCGGLVTVTPNAPQVLNTIGTNRVQWTFTDAAGNSSIAYQTGIVAGLTFTGFYSPINGTGGTCAAPKIIKCVNSTLPIKFDMKCGSTPICGGTPPVVRIQTYNANCAAGPEIVVANAVYQNDWHYNWNVSSRIGGVYKVTIVLPDGTPQYVFVKLK